MTQEQRLWLWLNYATEHNPKLFYTILQRFDSIEEVFDAVLHRSFDDFGNLDARVKERMLTASADRFLDRYIGWIEKNGIGITTPES